MAILRRAAIVIAIGASLSGCGYFQRAEVDDDVDLAEVDEFEKPEVADREQSATATVSAAIEGELELKLKVGDRFPLAKTIEQRLTQMDQNEPRISTSRTDMVLSLLVDEVHSDGRKRITVRYHKVQYEQDIRGKRIAYSSDKQAGPIPAEAMLYAGLANNGFSFWIGPNNKIASVIDFGEFLQRCLHNVPDQYKASVRQQLEATRREDGIANFIDDSIGLLPYSSDPAHPAVAVKEGSGWDLEPRHTESPIPMDVTTRCILKELTKSSAEILLTGNIAGSRTPVTMQNADGNFKVRVVGGYCTGTCHVDRKSGLPTQSRVQRHLELAMELPDGQKLQQHKDTLSTTTAFLGQSMKSMEEGSENRVQPTNFRNATGSENHRRVIPAIDEQSPGLPR